MAKNSQGHSPREKTAAAAFRTTQRDRHGDHRPLPPGNQRHLPHQRPRHQPGPARRLFPSRIDRRDRAVPPQRHHQHDLRQPRWHRDRHPPPHSLRPAPQLRHHLVQIDGDHRQQHLPHQRRELQHLRGRGQRRQGDLGPGPGKGRRHPRRRLQLHRQRRQPHDRHGGTHRPGRQFGRPSLPHPLDVAGLHHRRRPARLRHPRLRLPALQPGQRPRLHL